MIAIISLSAILGFLVMVSLCWWAIRYFKRRTRKANGVIVQSGSTGGDGVDLSKKFTQESPLKIKVQTPAEAATAMKNLNKDDVVAEIPWSPEII